MADVRVTLREGVQTETIRLTVDGRTYTMDEIAAMVVAGRELAQAVQRYFNKRGAKHAQRKGNEDIFEMAEALANFDFDIPGADVFLGTG